MLKIFLRGFDNWGTAIWKRSEIVWPNANKLLNEIKRKKLIKDFNFDNSFDWFSMLERCAKNQNQSWSVRWYASTFLKKLLLYFPRDRFVKISVWMEVG